MPVKIIRSPGNRGIVQAKHSGINAASGDVILSLDCDSRISPNFLSRTAHLLQELNIGLVSGWSGLTLGQDLFTRYSNVFGDIRKPEKSGPVDFIGGAAFALRKNVWEEVGGFSGCAGRLHEDHYLGRAVKAKGYQLFVDVTIWVKHARLLSRQAYCSRFWKWCKDAWLNGAPSTMSLPEYFQKYFGVPMLKRSQKVIEHFPLEFFYFELLQFCFIPLSLAAALGAQGRTPGGCANQLWGIIEKCFSPYPALWRLLKADCIKSGALPLPPEVSPSANDQSRLATVCDWGEFQRCLGQFAQYRLFDWLEREGIRKILEDESSFTPDFSSYL